MKHLIANQIRIFLAIVESGSITAAANKLNMGKSGVSDALKYLESSLGVLLLVRTTRRQRLTPLGETFYRRCRALNDLSTATLEEVSEHLAEPIGPLRVTSPHAMTEYCVAPVLAELLEKFPRLVPELVIDDKRLDLIERNIDLALTVGEMPDSEFKARRVGTLKDILCASPEFLERHNLNPPTESTVDGLQNLSYIANHWEGAEISHTLITRQGSKATTFHFNKVATVSTVNAVYALIKHGAGVGILPHFFLREKVDTGELVELLPNYEPHTSSIYAIHPYGSVPPLGVRTMIEAIKARLKAD